MRVVNGKIIIYQIGEMHPLVKILHVKIRGVDTSATIARATTLIKNVLLRGKKILYLNPEWSVGHGEIVADVFVDDQSLAQVLINQGCAQRCPE